MVHPNHGVADVDFEFDRHQLPIHDHDGLIFVFMRFFCRDDDDAFLVAWMHVIWDFNSAELFCNLEFEVFHAIEAR